jgi:alpha-beta hydrolase superfamily lysophospholipase
MKSIEFSWTSSEGSRIYANEWRPEGLAKGTIALVHGIGEHLHRYDQFSRSFADAGYGVVAFDWPGHGRSEGIRGHASYEKVYFEVDRLLEETRARYPGKPVFLYGHSMGGALVLAYALKRKPAIAGVVSTSPGLRPAKRVPGWKILLAHVMSAIKPSFTLPSDLDRSGLSRDPDVIRAYNADPLVHGMVSARLGLDILETGPWVIEHAAEFSLPLLLLWGTADRVVDPTAIERFAAAAGPGTESRRFEGGYHELHNEPEKAEFVRIVKEWFVRVLNPKRAARP